MKLVPLPVLYRPLTSPFDRAFSGRIDLRKFRLPVEKTLHVIHQKSLGVRVHQIEAVVIDDTGLGLQPFSPAGLTNFGGDFLAQFSRQRREAERWTLLPATGALNHIWHCFTSKGL